jgi:hypothetical protein
MFVEAKQLTSSFLALRVDAFLQNLQLLAISEIQAALGNDGGK